MKLCFWPQQLGKNKSSLLKSLDSLRFSELELCIEFPIPKQEKVIHYWSGWHEHILNKRNFFVGDTSTNSLILRFLMSLSLSIFYSFLKKFMFVSFKWNSSSNLICFTVLSLKKWNLLSIREKCSRKNFKIVTSQKFMKQKKTGNLCTWGSFSD